MEWIDFLKFVLIEDIKNLFFYLLIKQKDVYLIYNTLFYLNIKLDETYGNQLNLKKKFYMKVKKI